MLRKIMVDWSSFVWYCLLLNKVFIVIIIIVVVVIIIIIIIIIIIALEGQTFEQPFNYLEL